MFPLIFLLICLVALLLIIWVVLYEDILSPSVLLVISFIGATLLLLKGAERLEIKEYSYETVFVFIVGIFFFILGGMIRALSETRKISPYSGLKNPKPLIINKSIYVVFVLFAAFVAYVQFKYELAHVGYVGTFTEIVSDYRDEAVKEGVESDPFVALSSRIIFSLQPLLIFLTLYNKIVCKRKLGNWFVIIPCIITYVICIFVIAGSRGKIFTILFQILFALSICHNLADSKGNKDSNSWKNLSGNKIWIKFALLTILIGIPTFYYVGVVQGKKYSDMSLFEPVENYFSYGLIHLNHTVTSGVYETKDIGGWSFAGLYALMNKFGANYPFYDSVPFYDRYGNTLTLFGRWYQDFNIVGVIVMSLLVGYFFSFIYYRMIYARDNSSVIRNSVFYVFFMNTILMASYDDWVKGLLTLNGIFQILFLYCILLFVTTKLNKKSRTIFVIINKRQDKGYKSVSIDKGDIVQLIKKSKK